MSEARGSAFSDPCPRPAVTPSSRNGKRSSRGLLLLSVLLPAGLDRASKWHVRAGLPTNCRRKPGARHPSRSRCHVLVEPPKFPLIRQVSSSLIPALVSSTLIIVLKSRTVYNIPYIGYRTWSNGHRAWRRSNLDLEEMQRMLTRSHVRAQGDVGNRKR
jgi:hypothetical protein